MGIDPDQTRRLLRMYKNAKIAQRGVHGYKKVKSMLDDHAYQTDLLMDAEEVATRAREKRVRGEDVRLIARTVVNSAPDIYRFVARHIRKNREANDA